MRRRFGIWCLRPWLVPLIEQAEQALKFETEHESRHGGYVQGVYSGLHQALTLNKYDIRLSHRQLHGPPPS